MRVLLIESDPALRRMYTDGLAEDGHAAYGATSWNEALHLAHRTSPEVILLNASAEPDQAARFVTDIRQDQDQGLAHVPIAGIAFHPGSEQAILEAGVQFLLRTLPTPGEIVKAVRWTASVYGSAAA